MNRTIKWFGADKDEQVGPQERMFEYAAERGDQAFIKWGSYWYASFAQWSPIVGDYLDDPRMRPERYLDEPGAPQLLCIVPPHLPCVFYMDIEWYCPHDAITPWDEALYRVKIAASLYSTYLEDLIDHECDNRYYVCECSRDTGRPYDPVTCKDGYKHSFHVTVRCDEHHIRDFAQLSFLASGFIRFISSDWMRERYPQLWFGPANTECIIDRGVYTSARAMRLPRCAKSTNGKPLRMIPFNRPALEENEFVQHVHGYVHPETTPFEFENEVATRVAPTTPRLQRVPRAPAQRDAREQQRDAIHRVLNALQRDDMRFAADRVVPIQDREALIERLLATPLTPAQMLHFRSYTKWFGVCLLIIAHYPNRDRGRELWIEWAAQFGKNDDPARQWDRALPHYINQRAQAIPSNVSLADRLGQFARALDIPDWRELSSGRFDTDREFMCLTSDDIHEVCEYDVLPPGKHQTIVFRCCFCERERFFGYYDEAECYIFNERYVSDHPRLVSTIRRALQSTGRVPEQARLDAGLHVQAVDAATQPRIDEVFLDRTPGPQGTRRTVLLAAQMGTGKTRLLEHLALAPAGTRVLILGMRVLLTWDLYHRLTRDPAPGQRAPLPRLQHYQQGRHRRGTIAPVEQIVLQLDSLLRVSQGDIAAQYDVVVLEEIESLLAHLSSTTLERKRTLIGGVLAGIVRSARLVLAFDADIGPRARSFLSRTRADTTTDIYRNLATPLARRHLLYRVYETWTGEVLRAYAGGLNFYVVSNSKAELDIVHRALCDRFEDARENSIIYSSKSDLVTRQGVADCNTLWCEKRVVLWTPVISAGVNFDPPDGHFDLGFALCTALSSCPRDMLQQAGRVRKIRLGLVHVHIKNLRDARENDPRLELAELDHMERYMCDVEFEVKRKINECGGLYDRLRFDEEEMRVTLDRTDPLTETLMYNYQEVIRSRYSFEAEYRRYALQHGDSVELIYGADFDGDAIWQVERSTSLVESHDGDIDELAGSQRSSDAAADINAGEITSSALQKEQWCVYLKVPDVIDANTWAWLKQPDFREQFETFLLLAHPTPHGAGTFRHATLFESRLVAADQYESFVVGQQLQQQHLVQYRDLPERAQVIREAISTIVGEAVLGNWHVTSRQIAEMLPMWQASVTEAQLAILQQLPGDLVNWKAKQKRPLMLLKKLLAVAGLYLVKLGSYHGGEFRLSELAVDRMLCMATCIAPEVYRPLLVGRRVPWFAEVIHPTWVNAFAPYDAREEAVREPLVITRHRKRARV